MFFLPLCHGSEEALIYAQSDIWVTAYYAGWMQGQFNNGALPAQDIDYNAVTDIIHFSLVPKADGSLDSTSNSILASNSATLISHAHAAGKKVLICVGGAGTRDAFLGATSLLTLPKFIDNLVGFMQRRGYDGIDIDWEYLDEVADAVPYANFITDLRARLDQITPRPLLTSANGTQAVVFTAIYKDFDQINLMTYDMSGAWPGWVTWHNSPISDGGLHFPSTGGLIPSADNEVDAFLSVGVPANKLGIGIDFYGYVWSGGDGTSTGGATAPGQSWTSPPAVQANVPYFTLMQQYYKPEYYRWDSTAQASYLSIDNPGSANDKFISYDNEMSVKKKIDYVRQKGLGGVIIWELGGGMLPASFSNRDRLLQTVTMGLQGSTTPPPAPSALLPPHYMQGVPTRPTLHWNSTAGTSWYRVQIAADSTFVSPAFDQEWIIDTSYAPGTLLPNTEYFWRVQSSNAYAASGWSSTARFTTATDTLAPPSWEFVSNTGNNATVLITSSVNPTIDKQPLEAGDYIGVFFRQTSGGQAGFGSSLVCAGYSRWEPGTNMTITAWGDNPQTGVKDGFAAGDTILIHFYQPSTGKEYETNVLYTSGKNAATYAMDGVYAVQSLTAIPNHTQTIHLHDGWNMVSSYIMPNDSSLQSLTASIAPEMAVIKDDAGNVFWPDSNINEIHFWNFRQGYQIYMQSAGTLAVTGAIAVPESTTIPLTTGWNLVAYLRTTPMMPDVALAKIKSQLVLVKNNDGDIFWPQFNINTIGTMNPGEGYKVYITKNASLLYPPNDIQSGAGTIAGTTTMHKTLITAAMAGTHYPLPDINTGNNAILLIESSLFRDGDEIGAWSSGGNLIGSGVIQAGKCALTIWGSDTLTPGIQGANEGEALSLTLWDTQRNREYRLALTSLKNGITNQNVPLPLRYQTESALIGNVKIVPSSFYLEQNYPNPFNPSTTIEYDIPQTAKVVLEVFNTLGERVAVLVNRTEAAGHYHVVFKMAKLASGMYIYRLQAGTFTAIKKMVLVK